MSSVKNFKQYSLHLAHNPTADSQHDKHMNLLFNLAFVPGETGHLFSGRLSVAKCRRQSLKAHCF